MKINVHYSSNEVEAIILGAHVARFGAAPDGMEWVVEYSYSGVYSVSARVIETDTTQHDVEVNQ